MAVLSHVDDDHVVGLPALLEEIRRQRDGRQPETIAKGHRGRLCRRVLSRFYQGYAPF